MNHLRGRKALKDISWEGESFIGGRVTVFAMGEVLLETFFSDLWETDVLNERRFEGVFLPREKVKDWKKKL